MANTPKKLFESKDMEGAILYAKSLADDTGDALPCLQDENGYLCVNMTVGTVSLSSTASTITNAAGNPVNVALTSTKVTIESASGFNVNVATATLGTVTITGTVTPSTTAGTVTNSVSTLMILNKSLSSSS